MTTYILKLGKNKYNVINIIEVADINNNLHPKV